MQTSRTMHLSMTLRFFREALRDAEQRGLPQEFVSAGDEPATFAEAYAYIDQLEADGYTLVPMSECDNFDKTQGCLGHIKETD